MPDPALSTPSPTTHAPSPTTKGGAAPSGAAGAAKSDVRGMDFAAGQAYLTPRPAAAPPKPGDLAAQMAAWAPKIRKVCDPVAFMKSGGNGHVARGKDSRTGFFAEAKSGLAALAGEIAAHPAKDDAERAELQELAAALRAYADVYGAIEDTSMSAVALKDPAQRAAVTARVQATIGVTRGALAGLDPAVLGIDLATPLGASLGEIDQFVGAWSEMSADSGNTDASPLMWASFLQTVERYRQTLNYYGKLGERGGSSAGTAKMAVRKASGATVTKGADYDKMAAEKGGGMALAIETYSTKAGDMAAMQAQTAAMVERVNKGEFATQEEAVAAFRASVGGGQASQMYYRQLDQLATKSWNDAEEKKRISKEEDEIRRREAEERERERRANDDSGGGVGGNTNEDGTFSSVGALFQSLAGKVKVNTQNTIEVEVKAAVAAIVYLKFEGTLKITSTSDGRCQVEGSLLTGVGVGGIFGTKEAGADVAITWDTFVGCKANGDSLDECLDLVGLAVHQRISAMSAEEVRGAYLATSNYIGMYSSTMGLMISIGGMLIEFPDGATLANMAFGRAFVPRVVEAMNGLEGDKADQVEVEDKAGIAGRVSGRAEAKVAKAAGELGVDYLGGSKSTLAKGDSGALTDTRSTIAADWKANGKIVFGVGPVTVEASMKAGTEKKRWGNIEEWEVKAELELGMLGTIGLAWGLEQVQRYASLAIEDASEGVGDPKTANEKAAGTAQIATHIASVVGKTEVALAGTPAGFVGKLLFGLTGKDEKVKARVEHLAGVEIDLHAGEGIGGRAAAKLATGVTLLEIAF